MNDENNIPIEEYISCFLGVDYKELVKKYEEDVVVSTLLKIMKRTMIENQKLRKQLYYKNEMVR